MNGLFLAIFGALLIAAIIWFWLCNRLFQLLETNHPEKYIAMGRPGILKNNTTPSSYQFSLINFILKGEYHKLNDPAISNIALAMRALWVVYIVMGIGLTVAISSGHA